MPRVSGNRNATKTATMTPAPSIVIVRERPIRSTTVAPTTKPVIEPRIAMFVTHPAAVARTRVGNNSERCAVNVGVHIEAPALASRIAGARIHPLVWV